MTSILLSLFALFLSGFAVMLGNGLVGILIPTRLAVEGVSADNIGIIMSSYAVGYLIGGYYVRRLVVRVGHIRVYTACAAAMAVAILSCYLWVNEWLWFVLRIVMGFSIASINIVADSWLSERATSETRGRILAANQIVIMLAMFFGSFLINIAPVAEATLYILAALLLCCGVVPLALSRASAPEVVEAPAMPLWQLFKFSPLGVVSVLVCGVALTSLLSMLVVYGKEKGIVGFDASLLLGAAIMGGFILQFPIGYLADCFNRRDVMLGIILLALASTIATPFAIDMGQFYVGLLLIAVLSGVISSLYPLGVAETFDRLLQEQMGAAIGSMMVVYALGGIVGPYLLGIVMHTLGANYFFFFLAFVQFSFAVFIVYRVAQRSSIPTGEQEVFVAQGASGWMSAELDPRTEYTDEAVELSVAAQAAVELAKQRPDLVLDMVGLLAQSSPDQLEEVVSAVAEVEGVDVLALYNVLQQWAPDRQSDMAAMIMAAVPEPSSELVTAVFDDVQSEDIAEFTATMTDAAPEQSFEIIEAATEAVLEDNPDAVLDIAETYINTVGEHLDEMRYADRLVDDSAKTVSDIVTMVAERAPEQAVDVTVAAIEAMPESAVEMVEALVESDIPAEELVEDIDAGPSKS